MTRKSASDAKEPESSDPVYLTRGDGRVERVCSHGVGHTVSIKNVRYLHRELIGVERRKERSAWTTHGCDYCCQPDWWLDEEQA